MSAAIAARPPRRGAAVRKVSAPRWPQTPGRQMEALRGIGAGLLLQRMGKGTIMGRKLKDLIRGLDGTLCESTANPLVNNLVADSRRVTPGALFAVLPGRRTHGAQYVEEAVERGAVAILSAEKVWTPPRVPLVIVADLAAAMGHIASRFHGAPEKAIALTGVLGTSGKTVVNHLLRELDPDAEDIGLIGSIHYAVGRRTLPAYRTTPELFDLYGLLAQMRDNGAQRCCLEVSSHGIDQRRVEGLALRELIFTNLSSEHLHYHGSEAACFELQAAYIEAQIPSLERMAIGIDTAWGRALWQRLQAHSAAVKVSFGIEAGAQVTACDLQMGGHGSRFRLVYPGGERVVRTQLLGRFNVENILAVAALVYARDGERGIDHLLSRLSQHAGVAGRMQRVEGAQPFSVVVDYMHTEASYSKGLQILRELAEGRLITVFGCGGNRDRSARPRITAAVRAHSDLTIVTADNPRNEKLSDILEDMFGGDGSMPEDSSLCVIEDRHAAIEAALREARPGDLVLIAGKGHETYQEFGDCMVPFDDRAVAREVLERMEAENAWG